MLEKKIKNSIIGTFEEKGIFYLEQIDKNNNIIKHNLIDCLAKEEYQFKMDNNKNNSLYKFKIEKKFMNSNGFMIFTGKLKKSIFIIKIKNKLNEITNGYKNIIEILERKIAEFKESNDAQISFAKKIISIFKSSIESKNFTNEFLLIL